MKILLTACLLLCTLPGNTQPNCNVYKWQGDSLGFKACELYTASLHFSQGSRMSQIVLDSILRISPAFDEAWRTKSIPYLKRGDFITWKTLIDRATELNPAEHLGYRGWCRYQFLRDFAGALEDLERLDSLKNGDPGYSANGDYHLNIARALCYKGLGQKDKAIKTIERQLAQPGYSPGLYDYLHLGVLYLESKRPAEAIDCLDKQEKACAGLAENYYYLALAWRQSGDADQARRHFARAKEQYLAGRHRTDPYDQPMDRIYLSDIEREMDK